MTFSLGTRQARRAFILGLSGVAALSVAGCQTGPRGPRPGPGPVEPQPTPTEAPRNLVALVVPLTGADSGIGTSIANAASLALYDTGEKSIRLSLYDSAGPGGAAAATNRALGDGAGLILGPLLAEDVRAATPIARKAGVPVIAFSNDERVAGNGAYIMGFTPDQSIARVVSYVRGTGKARFGGLVPSGVYGERASRALLAAVLGAGGRLVGMETYNRSTASVRSAATRLKGRGAMDAILIGDGGRMAAMASPSLPASAIRLGTELWANDKTLGATPSLRGALYAAAPDTRFNQLVTRYRARYNKTPYRLASLGYDAMLLAVRSAPRWPVGKSFPTRTLTDKDGFAGVDGNFRFGRGGVAQRLLEVRRVTATGSTVVSKAATAF